MSVINFTDDELQTMYDLLVPGLSTEDARALGAALLYVGTANRAAYMVTYEKTVEPVKIENTQSPVDSPELPKWADTAERWIKNLLYNCITNGGVDFALDKYADHLLNFARRYDEMSGETMVVFT